MGSRRRVKPKVTVFVCRLMYNGSKKPDNSDRSHRTKGRKMTPSFRRNRGNKGQFVRRAKCLPVDRECNRSQRPWRCRGVSPPPVTPLYPFGYLCSQWNLLHSCLSIFLQFPAFPLHYSLDLSSRLQLLLAPSAIFSVSLSSFPPFQPLSSLLLFNLSWKLQSIFPPVFLLHHFCPLTPLSLSFMSWYWSRPLLSQGGCYSY